MNALSIIIFCFFIFLFSCNGEENWCKPESLIEVQINKTTKTVEDYQIAIFGKSKGIEGSANIDIHKTKEIIDNSRYCDDEVFATKYNSYVKQLCSMQSSSDTKSKERMEAYKDSIRNLIFSYQYVSPVEPLAEKITTMSRQVQHWKIKYSTNQHKQIRLKAFEEKLKVLAVNCTRNANAAILQQIKESLEDLAFDFKNFEQ